MWLHHADFEAFERLSSAEIRAHALLSIWLYSQSLFSFLHSKAIFTGLWDIQKREKGKDILT